jgi:hypothetical protein
MKTLTRIEILLAANALIRVLELKAPNAQGEKVPVVIEEDASEADITAIVTEAVGFIEPRDGEHFTAEEKAVIHEFAPDLYGDAVVDPPAEEPEETLLDEVTGAQRLSQLKDIATSNDEFKSIRGQLSSYKTAGILKDAMLKMLSGAEESTGDSAEVAEKIHEKNIESKGVNEVKDETKAKATPKDNPEDDAEIIGSLEKDKPAKVVKDKPAKADKPEGSKTRAGIFAEIYAEGKPLSMSEWSEQMNARYSSDSLAGAKTFTSLYMQILLELGFVVKGADGKYVKAGKK